MTDLKLFELTEKDKKHYLKLIEKVDPVHSRTIIKVIGKKIAGMLDNGNLNNELSLSDEISKLIGI